MSTGTTDVGTHSVATTLTGNGCPSAPSRRGTSNRSRTLFQEAKRSERTKRSRRSRAFQRIEEEEKEETTHRYIKITNRFTEAETLNEYEINTERKEVSERETTPKRKMMSATVIFVSAFNILWSSCQAIPLLDLKSTLEQNVLDAVVTSACSPNEECWEWLPIQDIRENTVTVPKHLPVQRVPIRREAPSIDPNTIIKSWSDNTAAEDRKTHSSSPATKQLGTRLSKKDVLMSRSWSAGGMPFSVLYMSPHGSRGNHGVQQEIEKATESSTPSVGHPNYRIALRNGAPSQPRRQYSIIPQLFISYGWGPFGK